MDLITLVVTLGIVGLVLWLIETYIPMNAGIKRLIQVVVIIFVIIWLLQSFGIIGSIGGHSEPIQIR